MPGVEMDVGPLAGLEIPDGRAVLAVPLVDDRQSLVARHRRPCRGVQTHALVAQVGHRGPGSRVEDPQRGMDDVVGLGDLHTQQPAVRGQPASREPDPACAPDGDGLDAAGDLLRRLAVDRRVQREAVTVADRRHHDAGGLGQPLVPAVGHARQERLDRSSVERLVEPPPGSSPVSSWNQSTPEPSRVGVPSMTPTG